MEKKVILETARSYRMQCFICGRKNEKLYKAPTNSIAYAYLIHKILIKNHAKLCVRHFNEKREIKEDHYFLIRTIPREYNKNIIKTMDSITQYLNITKATCIFDQFKNIETLQEAQCIEITGWSKAEFIEFSRFITSINKTNGRTKGELIALYRFWMKKGIDQASLAMFRNNTSQQKISRYLKQIRIAINKDFVGYYLGSSVRSREFFLQQNTPTCKKIFNVDDETLCVIADGTYARCEKSANNEFQYSSYSCQKLQNLIKPFLLCTPNGYIIDCYVGFKAHENDSSILDYILKTDKDLLGLLQPNKTMFFLDRGFRDIFKKLKSEYLFEPKIPYCQQLEDEIDNQNELKEKNIKQLKTLQTTDTRLVTKIRFQIERSNGFLKNNYALDFIRNTQVGHIQIDYRIACAMSNFVHKPSYTDMPKTEKVSKRIKELSEKPQVNKLEFLINKRLGTSLFYRIDITEINDFIKLKRKYLKRKIFLGSYQLKMSKSYLIDILDHNVAYSLDINIARQISNVKKNKELRFYFSNISPTSKIIAVEVLSRHKRGKIKSADSSEKVKYRNTYKVFINYVPQLDIAVQEENKIKKQKSKEIKGWICTCNSGRRIVGCCSHVAAVIYYLSWAKHNTLKFPGEHLNEVFIDKKKLEKPNQPKYIKLNRGIKEPDSEESSSSDDSSSDFEYSCSSKEKNGLNINVIKQDPLMNNYFKQPKKKQQKAKLKKNDIDSKSTVPIVYDNPLQKQQQPNQEINDISPDTTINSFKAHIPKWGGQIEYQNKKNVILSNTCTIDYYLFSLWILSKHVPNFTANIPILQKTPILKEIIKNIDGFDWNVAKQLWVNNIMEDSRDKCLIASKNIQPKISMFGSERGRFLKHLSEYQIHELIQICNQNCKFNGYLIRTESEIIYFNKVNNKVNIHSTYTGNCPECRAPILSEINFLNNPNFVFIEAAYSNLFINDMPKTISIKNKTYRLLCATVHKSDISHFVGIFDINNNFFAVDDIGQSCTLLLPINLSKTERRRTTSNEAYYKLNVTTSLYYLI